MMEANHTHVTTIISAVLAVICTVWRRAARTTTGVTFVNGILAASWARAAGRYDTSGCTSGKRRGLRRSTTYEILSSGIDEESAEDDDKKERASLHYGRRVETGDISWLLVPAVQRM